MIRLNETKTSYRKHQNETRIRIQHYGESLSEKEANYVTLLYMRYCRNHKSMDPQTLATESEWRMLHYHHVSIG